MCGDYVEMHGIGLLLRVYGYSIYVYVYIYIALIRPLYTYALFNFLLITYEN